MRRDSIEFHNVAELRSDADRPGEILQRVPEAVRARLNDGARERMRHPAGVELRFVADGPVRVTLSSDVRESPVEVYWGPFRRRAVRVGSEARAVELSVPEELARLDPSVAEDLAFAPQVCRLRLAGEHRGGQVRYHGVEGDVRPPGDGELPDCRFLAYGTSITEGEAATAEHLTYVSRTAERLSADAVNLGSCGTAYCDPAVADYVADRDDWDVATLALSVNMVETFSPDAFRDRAAAMIDAVAGENPSKPVACVTLFPHYRDLCGDSSAKETSERFRIELRDAVAASPHGNVRLIEGPDLLADASGLTTDLIHPSDAGMDEIARNLARRLEPLFDADRSEA